MKLKFFALLSTVCICAIATAQSFPGLMPMPKEIKMQPGSFAITEKFSISIDADAKDTVLYKAVTRFYQALNRKTSVYFTTQRFTAANPAKDGAMKLKVGKKADFLPGVDESYQLNIWENGIEMRSANTIGALRGLETLYQLCTQLDGRFYFPGVFIHDEPRFIWRGLMIDVSRHFIPLESIKRNVEAMAEVKMNVLHLHLSDNEGFRVESKTFPLLHQKGSNGDYYTQFQIRELLEFARDRGIMIVPEFDMPSHSLSWFPGYPYLSSSDGPFEPGAPLDFKKLPNLNPMTIMKFVQTSPFPAIDPSKDSTYKFMDKFVAEMSSLFPSPYFHIGADENNGVVWKNNPSIVKFMEKNKLPDTHALQAYFVNKVFVILRKYHRRPIGWEEIFTRGMANDVMVQVWQNGGYAKQVLENKNSLLISRGFYLDHFMPAHIHYTNPDINIVEGSAKALGGEAAQWTEAADANNIEARIWPRNAAVAERLWSDASLNDVEDMYLRLFVVSEELDQRGLQHINQYQNGIRHFVTSGDQDAVKDFLDALSPVKGYKKLMGRFTAPEGLFLQAAPLNEVSDVVLVDNPTRWKFHQAVLSYLSKKDSSSLNYISDRLQKWSHCADEIGNTRQAQLARVNVQLQNLKKVAEVGTEALAKLKSTQTPTAEWIQVKSAIIMAADKAQAETEISILGDILSLVKQQAVPLPTSYSIF